MYKIEGGGLTEDETRGGKQLEAANLEDANFVRREVFVDC